MLHSLESLDGDEFAEFMRESALELVHGIEGRGLARQMGPIFIHYLLTT